MEEDSALNYLQTLGGSTILAQFDDTSPNIGWNGDETSVRPVDPVASFFLAKTSDERWRFAYLVPRNESAVQQIINFVIFNGRPSDEDDTISLLAMIGWPTLGVALRFQELNVRPYGRCT